MNFDPKAVRRALMVAKNLATSIDPGFANINVPMPPEGVPLERAKGGPIKTVQGPKREQNLAEFMRGAHKSLIDKNGKPITLYHSGSFDESYDRVFDTKNGVHFGTKNAALDRVAGKYIDEESARTPVYKNEGYVQLDENEWPNAPLTFPTEEDARRWVAGEINRNLDSADLEHNLTEVHLNIKNPKRVQDAGQDWADIISKAKKEGHDGIVYKNEYEDKGKDSYIAFYPHQIKSAVGNAGTFDPTDPDITKAEGGEVDAPQGYTPQPPGTLETDNPGGEWLEQQKQYSASRGYRPSGAPKSFGEVTAVWSDRKKNEMAPVYLPVSMLKQIPGVMSEQQNVREHSLSGLVEHMGKTGRLPKFSEESTREYHPFITVDQRGMPFVNEGNHRIMAADRLGWKWLPVEVRYFNGGEDVDGPLHPDRIRAMHGIEPAKKAEGGAVDDELQQRHLNRMGMYSAAADAARALPQGVGTPQQMLASLKGVKPDELQWSGAQQAFANKPRVTKDELAQHFEENLPTLRVNSLEEDDSQAAINKYEDYNLRLPGGSNYKEDLIHLNRGNELKRQAFYTPDPNLVAVEKPKDYSSSTAPFLFSDKKYEIRDANGKLLDEIGGPYTNSPGGALDSYHRKQAYRKENDWKKLNTFRSSHYDDQSNIVAHVRRADRRGPDNEKILHLEEVQSDWGQTARDKGLNNPIVPGTVVPEEQGTWRINWPDNTYSAGFGSKEIAEQMAQERAIEKSKYVPSGPYIDTTSKWTDVALKHALNEAAKGNYNSIIWTPGDVQADRYDLSEKIQNLLHRKNTDNTYDLQIVGEIPSEVKPLAQKVSENDLPKYVGKELAKKIVNGVGTESKTEKDFRVLSGIDLKIGGEGMKSYYDKILPGRLLALAQEHDPKAKLETLNHPNDEHVNGFPMLKITPRMRESIKKRGFKAFSTGGFAMPKPVDADKAVRRAVMIAKANGGGLSFPPEDAAFRLRTKLNREAKVAAGKPDPGLPSNTRMVIRAPKAKEGESQLPNMVVGPLTYNDWIARHEKILTPEEIEHSSKWYKNIAGNFMTYTNNNEQEAKRLMRAWLVAQQNISPAGAMNNVLLQQEQMARGVPEHLWRAGGMPNPTAAARSVLQGQQIAGGVGQKISDFVDSAEGRDTRAYLGHDPRAGSPFVVDVHTARDTGMVDQELLNHLKRLGYNANDLAKAQIDFTASPSDAQYENRAEWGRNLTKHLNKIGWQGRKDWRPEEAQAVGWMGMTKLTRNAEEDSLSGLGRNLRRVSFELAPGEGSPWAQKYGTAFEGLPDEERYALTQKMGDRAMQIASQISGVNPMGVVHGTGAWMQYQNPASVAQALATQEGADIMANVAGHLLHQTEVWHNRVKPMTSNPKGFAIDFIEQNTQNLKDKGQLRDFWQKVIDNDETGLIQGYQPITTPTGQTGVRVLIDKGGAKTGDKLTKSLQEGGNLDTMLKSLPFDIESQISEAEISKARNDWKENQNGQAYVQRLRDLMGSDPSADLAAYGSQLEKELEGHLDEAYARQGRSWRQAPPAQGSQGMTQPPPAPTMATGGAVEKALRIASSARRF